MVFIDEIDSLLGVRKEDEHEGSRRIKTEFLVQFDGVGTISGGGGDERVLIIGATNRPYEIDDAARRRFRKRLYIPLPDANGRKAMLQNMLKKQNHGLTEDDVDEIVASTDGYSGSDMDGLIREAALGPIREIKDIQHVSLDDVRNVMKCDFEEALRQVRKSVSEKDLDGYVKFDTEFGSMSR